jgi:N-acetyl-gamma-glutamyl-phosphate reductase
MQPRVAIVGASGYSGIELTRLLLRHPGIELVAAGSDKLASERVEDSALRYVSNADAAAARCDVAMLATPAEVSHDLVPKLLTRGVRVVDLSGAYRLRKPELYPAFYKFEHEHPALLAEAVYGLPELDRTRIPSAAIVANPGCYATAIELALAPVVEGATGRIIVDAMSGVTGAGRKAAEEYSFAEVANDLRAYRVLKHQHTPEIEQTLGISLTFVPHLLPIKRGILATCHLQTKSAPDFARRFGEEPFISLAASADKVALKDVVGTNRCRIGWTLDGDRLVVISAIDNLLKGAAGQAVQNLNLMLGLPEQAGLAGLRSFHP